MSSEKFLGLMCSWNSAEVLDLTNRSDHISNLDCEFGRQLEKTYQRQLILKRKGAHQMKVPVYSNCIQGHLCE